MMFTIAFLLGAASTALFFELREAVLAKRRKR